MIYFQKVMDLIIGLVLMKHLLLYNKLWLITQKKYKKTIQQMMNKTMKLLMIMEQMLPLKPILFKVTLNLK